MHGNRWVPVGEAGCYHLLTQDCLAPKNTDDLAVVIMSTSAFQRAELFAGQAVVDPEVGSPGL